MPGNPNCTIGLEDCDCKLAVVTREFIPMTRKGPKPEAVFKYEGPVKEPSARHADLASIVEMGSQLGDRELTVLKRITNRLLAGQKAYGLLKVGKKDWAREATEEAMDMSVYLSALLADLAEK